MPKQWPNSVAEKPRGIKTPSHAWRDTGFGHCFPLEYRRFTQQTTAQVQELSQISGSRERMPYAMVPYSVSQPRKKKACRKYRTFSQKIERTLRPGLRRLKQPATSLLYLVDKKGKHHQFREHRRQIVVAVAVVVLKAAALVLRGIESLVLDTPAGASAMPYRYFRFSRTVSFVRRSRSLRSSYPSASAYRSMPPRPSRSIPASDQPSLAVPRRRRRRRHPRGDFCSSREQQLGKRMGSGLQSVAGGVCRPPTYAIFGLVDVL